MSKIRHLSVLAGACATLACGAAFAGGWTVQDDGSSVSFSFLQQGARYNGTFEEFTATIDFDPSNPTAGSIVGVVTTESVKTRDYDRDATLTESDWFDSANHPEARFESTSIEKTSDGYVANGELTIKGNTHPADMAFTFEEGAGSSATFTGTLKVNRFDYNVGEGWNDTSWIGQDVDVTVELSLAQ